MYAQPSYQTSQITTYFATLPTDQTPAPGYNNKGRGYPDISFVGILYPVYVAGVLYTFYGTSASCPLAAAMSK